MFDPACSQAQRITTSPQEAPVKSSGCSDSFFSAQQDLGWHFWPRKVQSTVPHNPRLSLCPLSVWFQEHDMVPPCQVLRCHAAPLPSCSSLRPLQRPFLPSGGQNQTSPEKQQNLPSPPSQGTHPSPKCVLLFLSEGGRNRWDIALPRNLYDETPLGVTRGP